jgi:hypothetical protein
MAQVLSSSSAVRTENFKQQNGKGGHVAALRIKRDNP